ncbi:glucose 1-dehydrogenase [Myxococcota bacterium]|nr:glucose 1-dehydrogenase [Myxococcota bacterium]
MPDARPGRLSGRTALVTGASRGIGEAIAAAMAREGATVLLASRKVEGLLAARDRILERVPGARLQVRPCHTGDPAAIETLFHALDADGITVDVLVNNAATNPWFGPMIDASAEAWDKTFQVNLRGPFELSRQVARRLIALGRPGVVIQISSVFGQAGAPFQGLYAMTKAALDSMTRTLAVEWGGAGIRVNAIAPGLIETRLSAVMVGDPEIVRRYTDRAALGRHGQPHEVAGMAVYLASDEASFVTGQTLVVDGGWTIGG